MMYPRKCNRQRSPMTDYMSYGKHSCFSRTGNAFWYMCIVNSSDFEF